MDIKIKKLEKSQLSIACKLTPEEFSKYRYRALKELAENMEIKGFRKGKVPIDMASKFIKEEELYQYGAELCVNDIYPKIIAEHKIEPIENPQISIRNNGTKNNFEWEAVLPVLPQVKLADYKKLSQSSKVKNIEVKDKEIEESLNWLLKSRASYKNKTNEIKIGDLINADIETSSDGNKIEGGDMKNHSFVLGEGRFITGFEENLIGMKQGQTKNFSLIAPADYYRQNLRNKNLDFFVKINSAQETILPELNDDFVKSISKFDSIENLKKSIRDGIYKEKEEAEKERLRMEIIEKIAAESQVEIPDALQKIELEKIMAELKESLEKMGLNMRLYLEMIKKSEEDLKSELSKQAQKRAKIALTLRQIAKEENIEIADKDIEEEINKELLKYGSVAQAQKEIDLESLKNYTKNVLKNKKVFELLENYNKSR